MTVSPVKRLALTAAIIIPSFLFANGGGVEISSTLSSGNITLLENKDILLEKESLNIIIEDDSSIVQVKYILKNNGRKQKLVYGFPVNFRAYNAETDPEYGAPGGNYDNISNFYLRFNGNETATEKLDKSYKPVEQYSIDDLNFNSIGERWFTAELEFPGGESTLEISYTVLNSYEDYSSSSKERWSCSYSDREFVYVLAPSGYWGKGIVKEFDVLIDFSKAAEKGYFVKKISGLKLAEKKNVYSATFRDFNMLRARPLMLSYNVSEAFMGRWLECGDLEKENIQSSSFINGNEPGKAYDCDPATAWVEGSGKGGTGEWIEFDLSGGIEDIAIVNGMVSSEKDYYDYSRVKKFRLDLEYNDSSKSSQEFTLEDKKYPGKGVKQKQFLTYINGVTESTHVSKARITILEVYPGKKYKSACISDIYFFCPPY